MRKTIPLMMCMLIAAGSFAQQLKDTKNFKKFEEAKAQSKLLSATPNEAHLWFWEKPGNYWSLKKRSEFTYNSKGKVATLLVKDSIGNQISYETLTYENDTLLKEHLVKSWFNNSWINSYKINIWYNDKGEPIKEISQAWQNGQWEVFFGFATNKVYDSLANIETSYDSIHNGTEFVLVQKIERYFNAQQLMDTEITYAAMMSSTLEPAYKQVYVYNAQGLYDSVIQYTWSNNAWKNDRMTTTFVYDTLSRPISTMNYVWDGTQWRIYTNTVTNYLPYNSFEIADYVKPGATFVEYKRQTFLNDSLYNQIKIKYESWQMNRWVADLHETADYIYLPGGIIQEKLVKIQDEFGNMQNETKEIFYFNSTGFSTVKHVNLSVYPNPSTEKIFIKGLNADESTEVSILDLHGKVMLRKTVKEEASIDVSKLKPGLYLLRAGATVEKIVVGH